ncbi:unnamed protein product [Durusdinium trenchii]|uniref:PDZ domain-containing protein n=1 Tax=Durusdinium trenchii TaxID=1381693 RepID=A0ABP0JTI5_9DINO
MDSWIKAAREQAAKLGEDIQKQAILLADDAAHKGKRELSFREGPLGFELNGVYVAAVDPDGQAQQLGVQSGDKLVSIAGYVVPENPKDESVKRWLDEMIRPGRLTFFSEAPRADSSIPTAAVVFPKESDTAESGLASFDEDVRSDADFPSPFIVVDDKDTTSLPSPDLPELMGEARLRAELYAARDEARSLERELEDCKAECQELRHFAAEKADGSLTQALPEQRLQRLTEQLNAARKDGEEARKRCRQLQAQLDTMSVQCEELRKESAQNEDRAMQAMQVREQVLEDEVERLRDTIHQLKTEQQNSVRNVEVELRDGQDRIEELEKRLAQSARERSEMEGLIQDAVARGMTAENQVSSLQARCDRQVSELQRRIDELETEKANQDSLPSPQQPADKPATELEDKDEEEENQKDEQEGPVSISALAAGSFDAVEDVGELQARIHVLETQCSALQRKLNARPIVHANARTPRRPTVKRATGLLGVLREILEQLLRNFTERLLKRDAFLWVFYGHLCVLYVIAASCYAQTGVGSSTVDVDLHAKQALRGATG